MNSDLILTIFIHVIGGLGLFLLGMKMMSEGMQAVAGERLRRLISAVTDNRFVACGVGAAVTGIIQSSSVTAVMVVGMVNAGLMTLKQAVGVIMGTNIGTTITAWLIALHIADYGLPILGVAALFYLFSKNERVQFTAMFLLGLGMVFFGLELMKEGMKPLRAMPEVLAFMSSFEPNNLGGILKCVFAGALITAIVQSSSATVAITITLAKTGAIGYPTAVALVLGENIGTTITAWLASLGANTNAKRTAYAHLFFNLTGVTLMVPLFQHYIWILQRMISENAAIASRIAFSHSFFNIFVVVMLLPLIKPFARFVEWIVPAKRRKEKSHLTYLDVRMYDTPAIGIEQSHKEIVLMGEGVIKMMDWLQETLQDEGRTRMRESKLFHREQIFDFIQKEITEFISMMMAGSLSHADAMTVRSQLRMADEYESISDYIINILKLNCRLRNDGLKFTDQGQEEMLSLHNSVKEYIQMIGKAVEQKNRDVLSKALSQGEQFTAKVKDTRSNHMARFINNEASPLESLIYLDMLSAYRRIKDHSLNIAEALAGEK